MNVTVTSDRNIVVPLDSLVGTFRTFGSRGPLYEILGVTGEGTGSNVMLAIRVVTSGETLDYPLADAITDPVAP
jgi:Family of unknown function (DUF5397)